MSDVHNNPGQATAIGFLAIGLWSALAVLTKFAGAIPPFELLALSFSVAFVASVLVILRKGWDGIRRLKQPVAAWVYSFIGIFAYHALYFFALSAAPAAQASLINYLWPLLIVLFSSFTVRSGFRFRQLIGALLGFLGTTLVIFPGGTALLNTKGTVAGYLAAAGAALVWSIYSVANRRFREIPSDLIGGVCGLVAIAGACVHVAVEPTIWPTGQQWAAIVLLGIGPVGLAFFAWDHATKHGHVPLLGIISYIAPLLSTLLLILFGFVPAGWNIMAAAIMIVLGSAVASLRFNASRLNSRSLK
ncbi:MAG: DMT family transporter [Burkholderiaceae bacterium]|nr:DMT family transporter [Burkholderiaceae bacterium]